MSLTYKVFPGTPYYSNTSLTTKAGEIVNTIPAGYVNTAYGTVSIGGTTYYVAYGQMVSFYNSLYTGQQIDNAVTKVGAASATPASGGTDLFTTGGAYALQSAIAGKADKTDLSSINQTGSTCTETNGIAAGVYFHLDGDLVVAKTAIAYGATFTLGTNYEPPTAGALNALKSAIDDNTQNITVGSAFTSVFLSTPKIGKIAGVSAVLTAKQNITFRDPLLEGLGTSNVNNAYVLLYNNTKGAVLYGILTNEGTLYVGSNQISSGDSIRMNFTYVIY